MLRHATRADTSLRVALVIADGDTSKVRLILQRERIRAAVGAIESSSLQQSVRASLPMLVKLAGRDVIAMVQSDRPENLSVLSALISSTTTPASLELK